jgi:hypothetical protein
MLQWTNSCDNAKIAHSNRRNTDSSCVRAFVYLSISVIAIALFVIQLSFAIRVSLVTACLYAGLLDCIIMFGVFGDVRCDSFGFFHEA